MTSQDRHSTAAVSRRWRVARGLFVVAGTVCVIAGFSLWLVTRSWFIVDRIAPELARTLGGDVSIGRAAYRGGGRFLLDDVLVRIRGIDGPGADVCRVDRASIRVRSLLTGRPVVEDVVLNGVAIRISESAREAGVFNFMSLRPRLSEGEDRVLPPEVRIDRATLEVGEHGGGVYVPRASRVLSGSMRSRGDGDGWYDLTLVEVDGGGAVLAEGGFLIDGAWNVRSNEHAFRIDAVALDERASDMCPRIAQLWWDRMELTGRVERVEMHWSPTEDFSVEFLVDDIGLTLPIETADLWARYRAGGIEATRSRPRMQVREGAIKITRTKVSLEGLRGQLVSADAEVGVVGMPYDVSVWIDDIPDLEWENKQAWMEEVLATAPFEMRFRSDGFRVRSEESGEAPAIEIPLAVARILEKFRFSDWVLSTAIRVSRESAMLADGRHIPAQVLSEGSAFVTEASGAYERFRYPLHDVEAYLQFDNEQVQVHYLKGNGSDGAEVKLRGSIRPPGEDAEISLRLTATDVPFDDRLRGALAPTHRDIFDSVIHRPSLEALVAAGLTGPTEIGGRVDLDLKIQREPGPDHPTVTTGKIRVDRLGILYAGFPYPITVGAGELECSASGVAVVAPDGAEGLPVTTAGGGRGWLSGGIELLRDETGINVRPSLTLRVEGDRTTDLLYAAIPPSAAERRAWDDAGISWPGQVVSGGARWLENLALAGDLDYTATFGPGVDRPVEFTIDVDLRGGEANPAPALTEILTGAGLLNPPDWHLEDCAGHLSIGRNVLTLSGFSGRNRHGSVRVDGTVDLRQSPPEIDLRVGLRDMDLDRYVIDLLPADKADDAHDLWDRYRPDGSFTADLSYRSGGAGKRVDLALRPEAIHAHVDGAKQTLTCVGGVVRLDTKRVVFDDLRLAIDGGGRDDGEIHLTGSYGLAAGDDAVRSVEGTWHGGHLESPLIPEVLRLFGAASQAEQVALREPAGPFDARITFEEARDGRDSRYRLAVHPRLVQFRYGDETYRLELDAGAAVVFTPGVVRLQQIVARHEDGTLRLEGEVVAGAPMEATLQVDYDGFITNPKIRPLLPERVRRILDVLAIREGEASSLRGGLLHVRGIDDGASVEFEGLLTVRDAALRAGLEFTHIDGPFDLRFATGPGVAPLVDVRVRPTRATVLSQDLEAIDAVIGLSDDGRQVQIRGFRADVGDGAVTAEAVVGVGATKDYSVKTRLVGVPLAGFKVAPAPDGGEAAEPTRTRPVPSNARGLVYGSVDIRGERGRPETRVGRGVARVLGGELTSMPLFMQLLPLFHLTLPGSAWDFGDADFYIAGDRLVFERILLESTLLDGERGGTIAQQLIGEGEMDIKTFDVNLRFRARGGVLVVRDVLGEIGDQLAAIVVTGPLWDTDAKLVALPAFNPPQPSPAGAPPLVRGAEPPGP